MNFFLMCNLQSMFIVNALTDGIDKFIMDLSGSTYGRCSLHARVTRT